MKPSNSQTVLFTVFVLVISITVSCKDVLKVTGNYKNPKNETPASITSYLRTQAAKYDGAFIPDGKLSLKYILDSINGYLPAIVVFDKDFKNYIIDYKCMSAKATGLDSLTKTVAWKKNDEQIHQKLFAHIKLIDGTSWAAGNKDMYIFYIWAKYLPKKSKEIMSENNKLHDSFHEKIYVGAVNMDIQAEWK